MSPPRPADKSSTPGPGLDYARLGKSGLSAQTRGLARPDTHPAQSRCSSVLCASPGNSLHQDRKIPCKILLQCRPGKLRPPHFTQRRRTRRPNTAGAYARACPMPAGAGRAGRSPCPTRRHRKHRQLRQRGAAQRRRPAAPHRRPRHGALSPPRGRPAPSAILLSAPLPPPRGQARRHVPGLREPPNAAAEASFSHPAPPPPQRVRAPAARGSPQTLVLPHPQPQPRQQQRRNRNGEELPAFPRPHGSRTVRRGFRSPPAPLFGAASRGVEQHLPAGRHRQLSASRCERTSTRPTLASSNF